MRASVLGVDVDLEVEGAAVGLAVARGCEDGPAGPALDAAVEAAIAHARARTDVDESKGVVRDVLRFGKYKPTGRGKPASEYLHAAALAGRFPRIGRLVDVGNAVSLRTLLPISVVDLGRAGASRFVVRRGRPGERYVFNAGGQEIELEDLLLVAALPDDAPRASAVKDSMATKIGPGAADVLGVVYGPRSERDAVRGAADALAAMLREHAAAKQASSTVLG